MVVTLPSTKRHKSSIFTKRRTVPWPHRQFSNSRDCYPPSAQWPLVFLRVVDRGWLLPIVPMQCIPRPTFSMLLDRPDRSLARLPNDRDVESLWRWLGRLPTQPDHFLGVAATLGCCWCWSCLLNSRATTRSTRLPTGKDLSKWPCPAVVPHIPRPLALPFAPAAHIYPPSCILSKSIALQIECCDAPTRQRLAGRDPTGLDRPIARAVATTDTLLIHGPLGLADGLGSVAEYRIDLEFLL